MYVYSSDFLKNVHLYEFEFCSGRILVLRTIKENFVNAEIFKDSIHNAYIFQEN